LSNTPIPAQEVDLSTKRQRLYHVTWLNRNRLDMQLRPLLSDIETSSDSGRMGVLFKATFRGAVTLINHYLHFDIRQHPSAILLIMLKIMDDRSFDSVWSDYAPMIKWVNDDGTNGHKAGEEPTVSPIHRATLQLDSPGRLSDVNRGDEGVRQDDVQQDTAAKSGREKTDSDTGQ